MINLKKSAGGKAISCFLSSPGYIFCIMTLTALGNLFSLELPIYLLFTLISVYICCFGEDLRGMVPLLPACYILPSAASNPGRYETGVFSGASGICIGICGIVIALALIYYIFCHRHEFFTRKRRLLSGMLILSAAYLLGGIGSDADLLKNLPFALIQGASIILPYWLFSAGIHWNTLRKDYLAWTCFCTGGALVAEIFGIYCSGTVIIEGVIRRAFIYTGWGIHNNLGFFLAMMIPSAFYLAAKYHRGWIGTIAGSVFLIFVFLTCSRSSSLGGCLIYGMCVFVMLYYAKNRQHNTVALASVIGISVLTVLLFHQPLYHLFSDLLELGIDPSHRDEIYAEGLKLFAAHPLFGNSFFSPGYTPWDWSTLESFSGFFPPRWHNTIVQILASCGITGLLAYGYHKWQTVRLFLSKPCKEMTFLSCSVLVLAFCSLFDCHFFNIGPTLLYGLFLSAAEFTPTEKTL